MLEANIKIKKDGYVDEYPEFSELADTQMEIFWPWNEIKVEKDKHDLLTNCNEAETHGIVTTLKLFTKYETFIGEEYWGNRIVKAYPHVGPIRMASSFAHVELNSHGPFYDKINKELGLSNYKFYQSYLNDDVLKGRVNFLDEMLSTEDDELATSVFSIMEGAVLYSNFAYLKSFQSNGKNKIPNIVRGLNMSSRDENLHSIGGALLVNTALKEQQRSEYEKKMLYEAVRTAVHTIKEHEFAIISKTVEKGEPEGITAHQLRQFVLSRLNICLQQLNYPKEFEVTYNPIAEWFYKGINDYQMNDFFQGVGREYSRDWDREKFVFKRKTT